VLSIPLTESIATRYGLQSSYGWYIPDEANAIVPDSPAQKAWLEVWDIILEVNGNKVTYATPLPVLIQNNIPGDTLQLKVLKKSGKTVDVSLVLGQN
jgi:serine protease Do